MVVKSYGGPFEDFWNDVPVVMTGVKRIGVG